MERRSKRSTSCLPEEILRLIFTHLDDVDLESASLVCKEFYSLSSPIVRKLTLIHSSTYSSTLNYEHFQRLFKRFSAVKEIDINCPTLDVALLAMSNSGIDLEKLHVRLIYDDLAHPHTIATCSGPAIATIKSLQLNHHGVDCPPDKVIEFINLFPSLIDLNFANCRLLKDKHIGKVTSKLPDLQNINLSYCRGLSDKTLSLLSTNCLKLQSVSFQGCAHFTPEALYMFFCRNLQLSSVVMPDFISPSISESVQCLQVLKSINHLSLGSHMVQDAFLTALADSLPSFKSLVIDYAFSNDYTMVGLSKLLSACSSLENLHIHLPCTRNCNSHDERMSIVAKKLPNLKHIKIWSSSVVCQATLFSLVQNCPMLETILLARHDDDPITKNVYDYDHSMSTPTKKNYSINWIAIIPESDTWLRFAVESYCPNLTK